MKTIRWDKEKNDILKQTRGIDFESIVSAILEDKVIAELEYPNKKKYHNQKIYILKINNYIYAVPVLITKKEIFLKTIYPSRKYKKMFEREDFL